MFNKFFVVAVAHFTGAALVYKLLLFILPSVITSYCYTLASIIVFAFLSWFSFSITRKVFLKDRILPNNKVVLITGCDSGFGHNLAKRLDSKGFHVFATCMFPSGKGANDLRNSCSSRLKILELDVTKDESVEKAAQFVRGNLGSCEFWALVNNAGIAETFCVELCPLKHFQECMDVNVYGVIRITKALLPFLKKSKGRIVNVTSIAGCASGPHVAPYFVSKYAAVGLSYVLYQELCEWGISVISIEPEMFRTGLTDQKNIIPQTSLEVKGELKSSYDEEYLENYRKSADIFLKFASPNIGAVIDDLESAVSLVYPEIIYCPRRHELFRIPLFVFVSFPLSIQTFIVRAVLFLLRYKKPKCAH